MSIPALSSQRTVPTATQRVGVPDADPGPPLPVDVCEVRSATAVPTRRSLGAALRSLTAPLMLAFALAGPVSTAMAAQPPTPPAMTAVQAQTLNQRLGTLRNDLQAQQALAASGQTTGAAALTTILRETARMSTTPDDFMQLTQALFVHNDWIPDKTVVGHIIPPTKLEQPPASQFAGLPTTGWKTRYRDTDHGVADNDDQTHHLVAFMALGYYHGPAASYVGSYYHKLEENRLDNTGDINLGILAGRFGASLGHSTSLGPRREHKPIQGHALMDAVNRLCGELTDPTVKAGGPSTWSVPAKP